MASQISIHPKAGKTMNSKSTPSRPITVNNRIRSNEEFMNVGSSPALSTTRPSSANYSQAIVTPIYNKPSKVVSVNTHNQKNNSSVPCSPFPIMDGISAGQGVANLGQTERSTRCPEPHDKVCDNSKCEVIDGNMGSNSRDENTLVSILDAAERVDNINDDKKGNISSNTNRLNPNGRASGNGIKRKRPNFSEKDEEIIFGNNDGGTPNKKINHYSFLELPASPPPIRRVHTVKPERGTYIFTEWGLIRRPSYIGIVSPGVSPTRLPSTAWRTNTKVSLEKESDAVTTADHPTFDLVRKKNDTNLSHLSLRNDKIISSPVTQQPQLHLRKSIVVASSYTPSSPSVSHDRRYTSPDAACLSVKTVPVTASPSRVYVQEVTKVLSPGILNLGLAAEALEKFENDSSPGENPSALLPCLSGIATQSKNARTKLSLRVRKSITASPKTS